ncbi:MAG: hypothetical protein C5S40_05675 [ANME-2 cluster archaeon]|nr:hypothetical protein [ANME-2 cluster archaeon]
MSDGVYIGYPKRFDDLPIMVASDCVEIKSFFPVPFKDIPSIFIECGGGLMIRK